MHQEWARLLHDRLQDLVINPEAKRHSRAYSGDDEVNAFEEGAFPPPPEGETFLDTIQGRAQTQGAFQ